MGKLLGGLASQSQIGRMLYNVHIDGENSHNLLMHIREDTKNSKEFTRRIY